MEELFDFSFVKKSFWFQRCRGYVSVHVWREQSVVL